MVGQHCPQRGPRGSRAPLPDDGLCTTVVGESGCCGTSPQWLTRGLCLLPISLWQIHSAGFVQTHRRGQLRLPQLNSQLCFFHPTFSSSPFPSPFSQPPHAAPSVTAQHHLNSLNSAKANTSTQPHTTSKKDDRARKVGLWSQEQRKEKQDWIVATGSNLLHGPTSERHQVC